MRMLLRDMLLRTLLGEDVAARYAAADAAVCAIPCCGRCWCEDVAARYAAVRGCCCTIRWCGRCCVRLLLRDTLLRTLLCARRPAVEMLLVRGCCCAIRCCGRCCVRMLLRDTLLRTLLCARYPAADAAGVHEDACCCTIRCCGRCCVRMLLRDTLLRTENVAVGTLLRTLRCENVAVGTLLRTLLCEDVAARPHTMQRPQHRLAQRILTQQHLRSTLAQQHPHTSTVRSPVSLPPPLDNSTRTQASEMLLDSGPLNRAATSSHSSVRNSVSRSNILTQQRPKQRIVQQHPHKLASIAPYRDVIAENKILDPLIAQQHAHTSSMLKGMASRPSLSFS